MEWLSNDINELRAKAEEEVSSFFIKSDEKIIVYFSEFPSIAGFPFGLAIIKNAEGVIHSKLRQWDTQYDMDRWKNGVYNLDRLHIITDEHLFSTSETDEFYGIVENIEARKLPQTLQKTEVIALDGSDWQLRIKTMGIDIDYRWCVATTDIAIFTPLIEMLIQGCMTNSRRKI